jgi:predicted membrane protein
MANPLLPLLVLLIFLGLLGAIVYVVYSIASDVAEKTGEKMEKHNISLSKEGMRVQMTDVKQEDYVGGTQK